MQTERALSGLRNLKLVAMLAVGASLGAAMPVLADVVSSEVSTTCSADEFIATDGSEWAVPPSPGRPGEPY